jgi:hypothetical protein
MSCGLPTVIDVAVVGGCGDPSGSDVNRDDPQARRGRDATGDDETTAGDLADHRP